MVLEVSESAADAIATGEKAAAAGRDLVAAGGDGMSAQSAGVAATRKLPARHRPRGSGQRLRDPLGYDRSVLPLCRTLEALDDTHGVDVTLDLALASAGDGTQRWFCCVSACGFDSEANRWANTVQRISGTALYVTAVLRTLATYRPHPFRITVDGTARKRAVARSRRQRPRYGGGMHITPDADLRDGLLDCCIITDISRPRFLVNFPKVFKGTHLGCARWRSCGAVP